MNERANNIKTTLILMIIEANTLPSSQLAPVLDSDVKVEKNQTGKFAFLASLYFQEVVGHAVTDEGYYTISYVKEVYDWLCKEAMELKAKKDREKQEKQAKIPENTNDLNVKNVLLEAISKRMTAIVAERKNPPLNLSDLTSRKTSNGDRVLAKDYDIYEELIRAKTLLSNLSNLADLKDISKDLILSLNLEQNVLEEVSKYKPNVIKQEEKPLILTRGKDITEMHASVPKPQEKTAKKEVSASDLMVETKEDEALTPTEDIVDSRQEETPIQVINAPEKHASVASKQEETPMPVAEAAKVDDFEVKAVNSSLNVETPITVVSKEPKLAKNPELSPKRTTRIDIETLKVANAFRRVANCLNNTQVKYLEETTFTSRLGDLAQEYFEEQEEYLNPDFAKEIKDILPLEVESFKSESTNNSLEKNIEVNSALGKMLEQDTFRTMEAFRKAANCLNEAELGNKRLDLANKLSDLAQDYLDKYKEYLNPETALDFTQMIQFDNAQETLVEATTIEEEETSVLDNPKLELETLKTANAFRRVADYLKKEQVKYLEETTLTSRLEKVAQEYLKGRAEYLSPEFLGELQDIVTVDAQTVMVESTQEEEKEALPKIASETKEKVELETLKTANAFRKVAECLKREQVKSLEETTLTSKIERIAQDYLNRKSGFIDAVVLKELGEMVTVDTTSQVEVAEDTIEVPEFESKPKTMVNVEALKVANALRRLANFKVNQVKELSTITTTHKQEQLALADNLRNVANYLNQTQVLELEENTQSSKEQQVVTESLKEITDYLSKSAAVESEPTSLDNEAKENQQYKETIKLLMELINKHGLYSPKVKYKNLESYFKVNEVVDTVQLADRYKKLESKLDNQPITEISEPAASSSVVDLAIVDDFSSYLEENREKIKEITLELQELDSKEDLSTYESIKHEILDCLLIILKMADEKSHLIELDNGLKIRISDISTYYHLIETMNQEETKRKSEPKDLSVYHDSESEAKRLYNPKHLKTSKIRTIFKRKLKMLEPFKKFVNNYWKQALCGLLAGVTLSLASLGIYKKFSKDKEPEEKTIMASYINPNFDFEHIMKYPFGTVNNIKGDYATKDYYLINLDGTVYLTTRSLNKDTGYLEYYDARDNTVLVGKYFVGSITNSDIKEEQLFAKTYSFGQLIINEAVVPLREVLPFNFFSESEFKWFTSNNDALHKMLKYNNKVSKEANSRDYLSSLNLQTETQTCNGLEGRKLQEFNLIYRKLITRKIIGYRLSEDSNSLDYNMVYDIMTGEFLDVSKIYSILNTENKEVEEGKYSVEQISEKINEEGIDENNILVLKVKGNEDLFKVVENAKDVYYLVFDRVSKSGNLIFKDLFNSNAKVVLEQYFCGLSYIDEENGVNIETIADIGSNDIVTSINDFFMLHGFHRYMTTYDKESLINSIDTFNSYLATAEVNEESVVPVEGAIPANEILVFDTTSESFMGVIDTKVIRSKDVKNGNFLNSNTELDYESGRHKKYYFLRYTHVTDENDTAEYVDIFDEYSTASVGSQLSWIVYNTGFDLLQASSIKENANSNGYLDMAVKNINVFLADRGLGDLVKDYFTIDDLAKINEYLNAKNMTRKLS